jgi:hypothetical protein
VGELAECGITGAMDAEEIKRKTEQFLARDEDQDLPEVLYHYCPFSAFVGIIESGELWWSHQNSMNDLSEARWFLHLLQEEAQKIATEKNRDRLFSFIQTFELNLKDYFILSFSTEPDILSQWVMYADNGRGVAIGFYMSSFDLPHRVPYMSGSSTNRGIFLVDYSEKTVRQRARDLIELVSVGAWGDIPPSVEKLSLSTKHVGFSNEKEVRIVEVQDFRTAFNPDIPGLRMRYPGEAYQYRVRPSGELVVYRSQPYRITESDFHLHSIWFGPEARVDRHAFHALLEANRIVLDCGSFRSEIPFTLRA